MKFDYDRMQGYKTEIKNYRVLLERLNFSLMFFVFIYIYVVSIGYTEEDLSLIKSFFLIKKTVYIKLVTHSTDAFIVLLNGDFALAVITVFDIDPKTESQVYALKLMYTVATVYMFFFTLYLIYTFFGLSITIY